MTLYSAQHVLPIHSADILKLRYVQTPVTRVLLRTPSVEQGCEYIAGSAHSLLNFIATMENSLEIEIEAAARIFTPSEF